MRHSAQKSLIGVKQGLSLYVHVPFCLRKCSYCDFNSYADQSKLIPGYVEALLAEIHLWSNAAASVHTIYFGGGTPSLLPANQIARILQACGQGFRLAAGAEVTLEANPGTVSHAHLQALRIAGVNRLSLGMQSFSDSELKVLGRIHSVAEGLAAYEMARGAGFDNVNLDLIFGLPQQSIKSWQYSLEQALRLAPDHISLYALTLEDDTPLGKAVASGLTPAPDPDAAADMYLEAEAMLATAGYEHYEISNWAKKGKRCHHNLTYWKNLPYLGLGAGAHSSLGGYRFFNVASPLEYIQRIERKSGSRQLPTGFPQDNAIEAAELIDLPLEMAETMFLGLRLREGVKPAEFARRFGVDPASLYQPQLRELSDLGLLLHGSKSIRLTAKGRLLGNEVFVRFLPE